MKILIPYFQISGTDSYPDSTDVLQITDTVEYLGNTYFVCEYTGNKNLQVGATYEEYILWAETQPILTGRRIITKRAFWTRVSAVKYAELIRASKDDNLLAARISMINGAEYVDLDDEELQGAFEELKEAGFFTEEEGSVIFADGNESELPINLK